MIKILKIQVIKRITIKKNNYKNRNNLSPNNSHDKNNNNNNKKNKFNYKNINKFDFRSLNGQSSYAQRHKLEKEYKINEHFHPNEEKYVITNKNIFLGRTLPEMIVLNSYRLVNDDDYEMYQNIFNYNKNHKKIKVKKSELNSINDNNVNYINNNTDINKLNLNQNSKEFTNKNENIHTSYL